MPEVAPSTEQREFVPTKERKEYKDAPYEEKAPFIDKLEGPPTDNPPLFQFIEPAPYPFTRDDDTVALKAVNPEVDQILSSADGSFGPGWS